MEKEVAVVGGGVVGLVMAKELARNGVPATVYEARGRIGEGANKASGIVSVGGLESIGVDYHDAIINSLDGAVLYAGKESLNIKAKETKAYVLDREILAQLCAKEAKEEGARIVLGTKVGKERLAELGADKIIVGADGVISNVASHFGFPKISNYVLTYKAEYEHASIRDRHSCEVFFSDAPKKFFGWTVPLSSSVLEVGVGEWMRSRRNSLSVFNTFITNPNVSRELDGANRISGRASMIPLQARKTTVKGNVLLAGDAAGQVKATTGGGIVFGALCGKTAAEAIVNHFKKGAPLSLYERMWRKKYGLDLGMHQIIHGYYSSMGPKRSELLFRLAKIFGVEGFLSEYGDMDRPSKVVKRIFAR